MTGDNTREDWEKLKGAKVISVEVEKSCRAKGKDTENLIIITFDNEAVLEISTEDYLEYTRLSI